MDENEKITLIGAGLVGSLLAVLLAKKSFKVEIFERRPDMRKTDISAGRSINLALANRGIYPLEQAGLMNKVLPILTTMKGRMIHDLEGNENFQSYGQKPEEVIYSVSRGELNKICMDAAEATGLVTIHFEKKCESVDFSNKNLSVKDTQSDQLETHSFNRVIGCDGSASAAREAIHEIESKQLDILQLGHSYKELCIPAGENGEFKIDKHSLHIWPRGGFMLIALPNSDASFTVTLFMPTESNDGNSISFKNIDTNKKVSQFFEEYFPTAKKLLPNLEKDFFENPTGQLATVKCSPWHYKDLGLLLGDAAHAVVPFHGQGMNCGFEDALDLAQTIDSVADENDQLNWQSVFSTVDKNRKVNGDAIADMAIENYITMRDSVRDEKFLLRSQLGFLLEKQFPNYFCPRYSMVMFHRLPYSEAKARGAVQEEILVELTKQVTSIDDVDIKLAESLIMDKLDVINLNG